MKILTCLLITISMVFSYGQDKEFSKEFDLGKTEKGSYQNEFFNLEVSFDSVWIIQDKQQLNNLIETGSELVTGDDENLKSVLKASMVNTAYLLTIFKYEVGSAVDFNPSFMIVAENTKNFPGIKNGGDYLFHTKKLLQQSQMEYYFDKELFEKQIDNAGFHVMEAKLDYLGKSITQEYMTTVTKGFSLSFIISHTNAKEKEELSKIINTIRF